MPARSLAFALALVLVSLARVEAATLTFSDGTFADPSWSHSVLRNDAGILYTQAQSPNGGNPDAYRRFEGAYSGSDPAISVHANVYNFGTFTPALQGSIDSLDFDFDIGAFDTTNATFRLQALLRQGSAIYSTMAGGVSVVGPPQGWTDGGARVESANFFFLVGGTGPATPDFSASGAPISFGYLSQFNFSATNNLKTGGIDNWMVTVDFTPSVIPEPEVYALLLASLGLLGVVVRMRRRK